VGSEMCIRDRCGVGIAGSSQPSEINHASHCRRCRHMRHSRSRCCLPYPRRCRRIDYSLKRWSALTRFLNDPGLPIDNNHDEQQIRPWATGRKNGLFAGTLMAGQWAAAITSLIQSAKLNGHGPYGYLKDVLARLPTQLARDIDELLPHRWTPSV
jgi:hypothetical protein